MKRATFWAVAACLLAFVVVTVIWPGATWHRIHDDFWPADRSSVGPNLVASVVQWLLVAIVAVIVYPPLRRFVVRELEHVHHKLDTNREVLEHIVRHTKAIPNEHGIERPAAGRPPRPTRGP